jgi:phosphoribosylanthranilate isomerase
VLQFHGDEDEALCLAASAGRPYLKAARIPRTPAPLASPPSDPDFDLVKFAASYPCAKAILLDALVDGYGGAGHTFDWSQLPAQVPAHLVLSGGLTVSNVGAGIQALKGRGLSLAVDVSSGVEESKGIKSAEKIFAFMAAVRAADQHPKGV